MFEHTLVASQSRVRSRARLLFIPIAFAVHVSILVGVAVGQYWTVGPVAEPPIQVSFMTALAPPPPPAGPPPAPGPSEPQAAEQVEIATEPVQPIRIPDQISPAPPRPESIGVPGGMPHGVPNGVPNGAPDGAPWGVPNGVPDGVPHGVPGDGRVLHVVGDVVKPVALDRVQPLYTEAARRARIQGVVIVETIIDTEGHVTDVRVLKSLPMGLSEAAVGAVKQWRFKPATLDARPVSVYFTLTVKFELQ
jgi:protein TonB